MNPFVSTWQKNLIAFICIANYQANTGAMGQFDSHPLHKTQVAACPQPGDFSLQQAYGAWRVEFDDGSPAATLQLQKHAELAGSLEGHVTRNGQRIAVAGDIEGGTLTLEESEDGKKITALWVVQVAAHSCGKELKGTWTRHVPSTPLPSTPLPYLTRQVVLRKAPGWG
jgi:hypothetical protein